MLSLRSPAARPVMTASTTWISSKPAAFGIDTHCCCCCTCGLRLRASARGLLPNSRVPAPPVMSAKAKNNRGLERG